LLHELSLTVASAYEERIAQRQAIELYAGPGPRADDQVALEPSIGCSRATNVTADLSRIYRRKAELSRDPEEALNSSTAPPRSGRRCCKPPRRPSRYKEILGSRFRHNLRALRPRSFVEKMLPDRMSPRSCHCLREEDDRGLQGPQVVRIVTRISL